MNTKPVQRHQAMLRRRKRIMNRHAEEMFRIILGAHGDAAKLMKRCNDEPKHAPHRAAIEAGLDLCDIAKNSKTIINAVLDAMWEEAND